MGNITHEVSYMDTLSHGLWGYLVYRNQIGLKRFLVGTIFPDIPFVLGSLWLIYEQKKLPEQLITQVVADQRIAMFGFPLHSLVVWGLFTFIGLMFSAKILPLALGWGFHIFLDLLTHISDATPLLWPISQQRYSGLISYWDAQHYSWLFNTINILLLTIAFIWLAYKKYQF